MVEKEPASTSARYRCNLSRKVALKLVRVSEDEGIWLRASVDLGQALVRDTLRTSPRIEAVVGLDGIEGEITAQAEDGSAQKTSVGAYHA